MPTILCISLSRIAADARVLRQISVLAEFGDVVTVGYGPTPPGAAEHFQVPDDAPSLPQTPDGVAKLALHRFRAAEVAAPGVQWALNRLSGRRFDVVVANEARVLALAKRLADGAPVWADMHEWAPEERTQILSWRLLVAPLMRYLCARYLPDCAAVTTVGDEIAKLYQQQFGVDAAVMRNAPPWRDLRPSPVQEERIRLVHSGAAVPGRNLEGIVDAVRELDERFTLDLYLVGANDGGSYLRQLREYVSGDGRVRLHDPVAPDDLPEVLSAYDVGVYSMPPIQTNNRLALPNKFFDFIQARLAIAIGPSVEMARLVREHSLGIVADDFSAGALATALRTLNADVIRRYKAASDAASHELSFERDADVARTIMRRLLGAAPSR